MQYKGKDLPVKSYSSPEDRDVLLRDINYAATWDTRDLELVQKQFRKIRLYYKRGDLAKVKEIWDDGIEKKFIRMWNGQYVQDTPNDPKPLDAVIKNDMLTNPGMVLLCSIIMNNTSARPTHYASGNGVSLPNIAQNRLDSERARISMETDGFRTSAGTSLRYGAIFFPNFPTHVISESGVTNAPVGGIFLNRTLYSVPRLTHTIMDDFYTLSITLTMTAI